jgi:hypothetical protein
MNGKTPFFVAALALAVLAAVLLLVQPYSADWPGTAYASPARQYIRAALRQDSVGLTRHSLSAAPVAWALNAARAHRDSLALWNRRVQAYTGETRGDTAEVFVYPTGHACDQHPIIMQFVGTGRDARVLAASSTCWGD